MKNIMAALVASLLFITCGKNEHKGSLDVSTQPVTESQQNKPGDKFEEKKPEPPQEPGKQNGAQLPNLQIPDQVYSGILSVVPAILFH